MTRTFYELKLANRLLQIALMSPLLTPRHKVLIPPFTYDIEEVVFNPYLNHQIVSVAFDIVQHCQLNQQSLEQLVQLHLESGWRSVQRSEADVHRVT